MADARTASVRATARVVLPALLAACAAHEPAQETPEQPTAEPTVVHDQPPPAAPVAPEPPAQPVPEPEPPRPADVRYTIELVDPAAPTVALHVECLGDADGESDFTLSEGWA